MLCALVQNNIVVSIVTIPDDGGASYAAASKGYQAAIDITNTVPQPQVGWTFNGNTLISNGQTSWLITKLALQNRFTDAENTAILAYMDNTSAPYRYYVKELMNKQSIATYIDLSRQDTIAGMNLLVTAGLITSARANQILTTPPTAIEIPIL